MPSPTEDWIGVGCLDAFASYGFDTAPVAVRVPDRGAAEALGQLVSGRRWNLGIRKHGN